MFKAESKVLDKHENDMFSWSNSAELYESTFLRAFTVNVSETGEKDRMSNQPEATNKLWIRFFIDQSFKTLTISHYT